MDLKTYILGGSGILVVLLSLIQISPIKINPWSWLGKCIGRAINSEVIEKVDNLSADLADHKAKSAERDATLCRTHILRFGDEILHGVLHSHEHYQQILLDVDSYEEYCDEHPEYKNNVAVATIKHIKNKYQEHMEKGDFLN